MSSSSRRTSSNQRSSRNERDKPTTRSKRGDDSRGRLREGHSSSRRSGASGRTDRKPVENDRRSRAGDTDRRGERDKSSSDRDRRSTGDRNRRSTGDRDRRSTGDRDRRSTAHRDRRSEGSDKKPTDRRSTDRRSGGRDGRSSDRHGTSTDKGKESRNGERDDRPSYQNHDARSESGRSRDDANVVSNEPELDNATEINGEKTSARRQWDKEHIATDLAVEKDDDDDEDLIPDDTEEASGENADAEEIYDDDFEDYDDDDFEEEEEEDDAKLDSGNYDRRSAIEKARMEQEIEEVKRAIVRENSARHPRQQRTKIQSSNDSGKVSKDSDKTSPQTQRDQRPMTGSVRGFINFSSAQQRHKTQVAMGKANKRGEELLHMISLNVVTFNLLELPPISYDAFMKTFGATNSLQAATQCGYDERHDEEVQTEAVDTLNKWTQKPPSAAIATEASDDELWQVIRGVGGDMEKEQKAYEFVDHSNSKRLSKFLNMSGSALLTLLEEEAALRQGPQLEGQEQKDVEFSDKVTVLNTDLDFLIGRPVVDVAFAPDQPAVLLTAHGKIKGNSGNNEDDDLMTRSFLCVWNVSQPSVPQQVLVANDEVSKCCFSPLRASIVFAGLAHGMVCAWDIREPQTPHQEVLREGKDQKDRIFRSATFTTLQEGNSDESGAGHLSQVTVVKPLPEPKEDVTNFLPTSNAFQLLTAEEAGIIFVWTVLDSRNQDPEQHLGLAHWGKIRLVRTIVVDLSSDCSISDVCFDPLDGSRLFVASDNGLVIHTSTHPDHRPVPRSYRPDCESLLAACRSLSFCPFGREQYFLAACDDGAVRLHAVSNERPLISWPGTVEDGQPARSVTWSQSRPCVFFVLDSGNSRVHLWDLGAGDIYPAHSVQFEEDSVLALALSPELGDPRQKQLLALGMAEGKVEVHHLKDEYKTDGDEACAKELSRFLHYVSII